MGGGSGQEGGEERYLYMYLHTNLCTCVLVYLCTCLVVCCPVVLTFDPSTHTLPFLDQVLYTEMYPGLLGILIASCA